MEDTCHANVEDNKVRFSWSCYVTFNKSDDYYGKCMYGLVR